MILCFDHDEYLYLDKYLDKTQTLNVFTTNEPDLLDVYEMANVWDLVEQPDGTYHIRSRLSGQYLYEF